MPYENVEGTEYWVNPRESQMYNQRDPWHKAAEQFACDVEEYLYREHKPDGSANPAYGNVDFLAWAVARYDATRSGSGHPWHRAQFDGDREAVAVPVNKRGRNFEGEITYDKSPLGKFIDEHVIAVDVKDTGE